MKLTIIESRYPYKTKIFDIDYVQSCNEDKSIYFYVNGKSHFQYEVRENVLKQLEFVEFSTTDYEYEFARRTMIQSWKVSIC